MTSTDLIVIGGGASGMTAAICAARTPIRVAILEHNHRVGKKILSTGNGRCNLSNTSVMPSDFHGKDPLFAQEILSAYGPEATLSFLRSIGVPQTEENGRIYPRTMQAQTVLDALRFETQRRGVTVVTDAEPVQAAESPEGFTVRTAAGETFFARALLFAPGGKAAPKSGSDGSANKLIRSLGHSILPQDPALMPLVTGASYRKALSGLRIRARAELYINGVNVCADTGQIQFTDYGVSGIPIFQISDAVPAALRENKRVQICLDLLPDIGISEIEEELLERIHAFPDDSLRTILNGFLPNRLVTELLKMCGMHPSDTLAVLFPDMEPSAYGVMPLPGQLCEFAWLCKALFMTVTAVKGFETAQTTSGGVPAAELTASMASRLVPGLYFCGEIVDIHGICGGYNLQWAFSSGMAAGNAAAAYVRSLS